MKRLTEREWVEKYLNILQNKELLNLIDAPKLPKTELGPWTLLKLAFLWNFAYHTYTTIIGPRYEDMCYVDLFSGSGLVSFEDSSKRKQKVLGSPILMSTINSKYNFKKCFFFEEKTSEALDKRLMILKEKGKLTCNDYKIFSKDCNSAIDEFIGEISEMEHAHFLLFVDPFSTEIEWKTIERLLLLEYPRFDMIFNFQPFGVNKKSYMEETLPKFFGDTEYEKFLSVQQNKKLEELESCYIEKLKKFNMVKTVRTTRVSSGGSGGYYYDLIYTTSKENAKWIGSIEHLKKVIEKLTGHEVSIITDPTLPSLKKFK